MTHEQLSFEILMSPPTPVSDKAKRLEIIKQRHKALHKGQR